MLSGVQRTECGYPSPDGSHALVYTQKGYDVTDGNCANPRPLLSEHTNEAISGFAWSAGGDRLFFVRIPGSVTVSGVAERALPTIEAIHVKSGQHTVLLTGSYPGYTISDLAVLPDGRIVYAHPEAELRNNTNLWWMRIDPATGKRLGEPVRLTQWAGLPRHCGFRRAESPSNRFWNDDHIGRCLHGLILVAVIAHMDSPQRLTLDESRDCPLDWMPDGKSVVFDSDRSGNSNVYRQELGAPVAERLTHGSSDGLPRVTPDHNWILDTARSPNDTFMAIDRIPVCGRTPGRSAANATLPDSPLWVAGGMYPGRTRGNRRRLFYSSTPSRARAASCFGAMTWPRPALSRRTVDISHSLSSNRQLASELCPSPVSWNAKSQFRRPEV